MNKRMNSLRNKRKERTEDKNKMIKRKTMKNKIK